MNVMRPYIDEGREIICFSISSEMSTSINVTDVYKRQIDKNEQTYNLAAYLIAQLGKNFNDKVKGYAR